MNQPKHDEDIGFGTLVDLPGIGVTGKICSGKSTLMFPNGIYEVEYEDASGTPRREWFHTAAIKKPKIN